MQAVGGADFSLHHCFLILLLPQLSQAFSGCLRYLTMNLSSSSLLPPPSISPYKCWILLAPLYQLGSLSAQVLPIFDTALSLSGI